MNNFEERLIKLETNHSVLSDQVKEMRKEHREEMKVIKGQMREVVNVLESITTTVNSIKWWLIGFISFIALQETGIINFIKKVAF